MFDLGVPLWEIVLRTAVVYVVVLGLLRIGGKRELGQMSPADLVVILIIVNAVQNAMSGGDVSLIGGIAAAATLVGMKPGARASAARSRSPVASCSKSQRSCSRTVIRSRRTWSAKHVDVEEIEMAAREYGIADLSGSVS